MNLEMPKRFFAKDEDGLSFEFEVYQNPTGNWVVSVDNGCEGGCMTLGIATLRRFANWVVEDLADA